MSHMKNFWIFAASLILLGCASAPAEKTRAQMRAEKADSDAFMILAEGLRTGGSRCDTHTR